MSRPRKTDLAGIRVGVISLGCAKNLVDTEVALGHFIERGAEITTDEYLADVLVVNTCGFIGPAKEESVDEVMAAVEAKARGRCRCLIVTGCLVERYRDELAADIPEVDAFLGLGDPAAIIDAVAQVLGIDLAPSPIHVGPFLYDDASPRLRATPPWTAWVKIAEGCDHACAFCVIPQLRGPYRSRSVASVVREIQSLTAEGVREVNLIAQDTTRFGSDQPASDRPSLASLLSSIVSETTIEWIRVLYSYPDRMTDGLLDVMAASPRILPYVDLPLQHVAEPILRAMKRPGNGAKYRALIDNVRERLPGACVRSAFIVGFPGETDEHFRELAAFIDGMELDRVFVFEYSPEEGTAAFDMEDPVPSEIAEERRHILMARQASISQRLNARRVGATTTVLCERIEGAGPDGRNVISGRAPGDAPEVDLSIRVVGSRASAGQFQRARITKAFEYELVGVAEGSPW